MKLALFFLALVLHLVPVAATGQADDREAERTEAAGGEPAADSEEAEDQADEGATEDEEAATGEPAPADEAVNLSQEQLEQLITTLESDTARQAFLDNLRALQEVTSGEESPATLTEILGIDETGSTFINNFERALDSLGLTNSTAGNLISLLFIGAGLALLAALNRWLAHFLNHRMDTLRQRLCLSHDRFAMCFRTQVMIGYIVGMFIFVYAFTKLFNFWPASLAAEALIRNVFTFLVILVLFVILWELMNGVLEFFLAKSPRVSASRIQTLLPVTRNLFLFILLLLLGLVLLSELGVNLVPLLAGAGILGIAIGFGAQTLIQDYINGFLIIMEDLLQVGDVIQVGNRTGLVEKITLRKIQLRSLDGIVHTVPYSEITVIDNYTKVFSYYMLNVRVAYKEDVDEVIACLKDIDEEMRGSEEYGSKILAPLEVLGVDALDQLGVLIKVRTKTLAHERWSVGREFHRRIKRTFDERGIEIPYPHQVVYFGQGRDGDPAPGHIRLEGD